MAIHQTVKTGAAKALVRYLHADVEDKVQLAAAWAVGRIARHCEETARPLAEAAAMPALLAMYTGAPLDPL